MSTRRKISRTVTRRHFMHQGLALSGAAMATSMWLPTAWAKNAKLVSTSAVETIHGRVRGQVLNGVNAFFGIPYGASTAGRNRFMPPRAPEPWSGVREVLAIGPVSPQLLIPGQLTPPFLKFCFDRPGTQYTEDCLNLNVWTPGVKDNAKRPVMVWLHGGGFTVGSSSPPAYDGENLARQGDVVTVSVNHRLNAFGYTDLGALVGGEFADAGNAGMLDIVAALQWVRDNIEQFGGDPNRVTIFGESGGGAKVCLLLAMPAAKGLFHRAIIQSGPAVRIAERTSTSVTASELIKELGITPATVGKLQELTQEQIAKAAEKIGPKFGNGFSPLRDGVVIPRHPFDPNAPDISRDVPVIVGYNRTEATLFLANDEAAFKLDDAGLRKRVEGMVGAQNASRIIDVYRTTYPKANPSDILFYLWTDRSVWLSSALIAQRKSALAAVTGGAPAYLYRFDWNAPYQGGFMRAAHTVEIPFVFNSLDNEVVQESFGKEAATRELGTRVSDMWIAFARTGKPHTAAMPRWPTFNGTERATMIINNESKVVADPDKEIRLALESLPPARGMGA